MDAISAMNTAHGSERVTPQTGKKFINRPSGSPVGLGILSGYHFTLELGFAMTVHKAQGRTIRRLILSLSCHPRGTLRLTWEALYVAMSRYAEGTTSLRILLKQGKDRKDLDYISDLKKDKTERRRILLLRIQVRGRRLAAKVGQSDLALTAIDEAAEAERKKEDTSGRTTAEYKQFSNAPSVLLLSAIS
ncbi:hypothetical protein THAOC_01757 [Thalassiosira oceanica]|uniref:UvrD-like helicase C-terminal domain-containing protein n=1 Tax=Thalassiosira oceanica TaxID=159749 RepID=K0TQQ9_THAOC|nr:hypothetical protein THAOC_01757 [Thalassiosira oceanica]|eukprot:EJK76477.1 hypothetical protein THAOC_01757 [Thalassiosira oceanica]